MLEAFVPVVSLIVLVGLSYFLFGDGGAVGPNQVALVVATMIAVFIGWRRGHSLDVLGKAAADSVSTGIGAIFILFAVGGLIGTWAMSGTLVAMVYYGLQLLSPNYFFVTACAICAIVAAAWMARLSWRVLRDSMGFKPGNSQPPSSILPWARATRHQTRRRSSSTGESMA